MMPDMPRPRPPFLQRMVNRHGAVVWYVRQGRGPRVRVRGEYGTPEFLANYEAALRGEAVTKTKAAAGTLAWLIDRYRESGAWTRLSIATRRQRENIFKHIIASAGTKPFARIDRKAVVAGRDRRRSTPSAARHFVQTMRGLFEWAVEADLAKADPTQGVSAPSTKTDGFHVWTIEECEIFEARWPIGTRERLAFDLLLYTGLRRGDAVRLGRPHVRNGKATIRTEKTGEIVTIPILPPLQASIDAAPVGELTFIAAANGRPLKKESFGNWFGDVCRLTGVPGAAHGLRKAGATRAAENGASEAQLDAMYGWRGGRMAALYTRNANRVRLATEASGKLMSEQDRNIYAHTLESGVSIGPKNKAKSDG